MDRVITELAFSALSHWIKCYELTISAWHALYNRDEMFSSILEMNFLIISYHIGITMLFVTESRDHSKINTTEK